MKTSEARDLTELVSILVATALNCWVVWDMAMSEMQREELRAKAQRLIPRPRIRTKPSPTPREVSALLMEAEGITKGAAWKTA